jgi:hypothetical protein
LRECGEAFHKVISPLRVELGKGVVKEEEWGAPSAVCEQFNLGEEECDEETALLTARSDGGKVASASVKGKIVSMRPNKRVALIALALRRFIKRLA